MKRDGDIIKGFNFSNSKFTYDISHLHFDECRFTYSTLAVSVVCSNTKFGNSDMGRTDFTVFRLLRDNSPLLLIQRIKNTFIRHKANLSGVILNEPG